MDPTTVEAGVRKRNRGVFRILECIKKSVRTMSKNEVSRSLTRGLVLKEKNGGVKARLCAKEFAHNQERRFVCADTWNSDSQDPADSRTQKRLDHESDRFCASISSRSD